VHVKSVSDKCRLVERLPDNEVQVRYNIFHNHKKGKVVPVLN
jgi:hypothetical protein